MKPSIKFALVAMVVSLLAVTGCALRDAPAPAAPDAAVAVASEPSVDATAPSRPTEEVAPPAPTTVVAVEPTKLDAPPAKAASGSGGGIEGRVTGASGPAVGVTVKLDRPNASTKTDAEGVYRFEDLPAGTHWVEVVEGAEGLRSRRAFVDVPTGKTAHLDFPGGASLAGRLVEGGAPIGGALVRVQRIGEKYSATQTRTGKDGTFRIDAVPPGVGRIGVQVLGDGGFSVELDEVTLAPGENQFAPRLGQGDASSEIAGRAFAKATGAPLSSRDVQITLQAMVKKADGVWAPGPVVSGMAFADAKGEFRIRWLRAGRYRIDAIPIGRRGLQRTAVDVDVEHGQHKAGLEVALDARAPK